MASSTTPTQLGVYEFFAGRPQRVSEFKLTTDNRATGGFRSPEP